MSELTHSDGRPFGMGRKAYVRVLDAKLWNDWVAERGGNDGAIAFICAQVGNGVSLPTICKHYLLDYGLLWAFVSGNPEYLERYYLAQRGVAEYYVGEVVGIADDADPEYVPHARLQIDTRMKVAAKWHRERYGDAESQLGAGLENLAAVLQRISERKRKVLDAPDIEDIKEIGNEEAEGQEAAEEVLVEGKVTAVAEESTATAVNEYPAEPVYI